MTEICGQPAGNRLMYCVEHKGHDGYHTYAPVDKPIYSDALEEVKELLLRSCPDWHIGDLITPKPNCCPYHHGAMVIGEVQKMLREMHQ